MHPGVTLCPCQTQPGQDTSGQGDTRHTQDRGTGGSVLGLGARQRMQPGLGGSPHFPGCLHRGKWQEENIQCYGNQLQCRRKQSMAPCHL